MNSIFTWLACVFVIIGALNILAPRAAFFLKEGWKFRDAQPSGLYLSTVRLGGLISIGIGIGLWLMRDWVGLR